MNEYFDVSEQGQIHQCECIDCGKFFLNINEYLRRCELCEENKYGVDPVDKIKEDSDTLEEALAEAEAELIRANERIDLLIEILSSLQRAPVVPEFSPRDETFWRFPSHPPYTTCKNG